MQIAGRLQIIDSSLCFMKDLLIVGGLESATGSGIYLSGASSCVID